MAAPHSLTHEQTSPHIMLGARMRTSCVPSGPLKHTHVCQNTMWTAQTECWQQTLHTHFTHYTYNFCFSGLFYFFMHSGSLFPFFPLLPFSHSLVHILFWPNRLTDRQMSPDRQWHWIWLIHLARKSIYKISQQTLVQILKKTACGWPDR